jgi:hypothetical protein
MQKLVLRPVVPLPAPAEASPAPADSSGTVLRFREGDMPERSAYLTPEWVKAFHQLLHDSEEGPKRGAGFKASLLVLRVGPDHAGWIEKRRKVLPIEPLFVGQEFPSLSAFARYLGMAPSNLHSRLNRGYGETSKVFGVEIQFNADMRD